MFISPSPLPLNSTPFASGTSPGNIHSATADPFPGLLPLSMPLAPPPDQSSNPPSPYTNFPPSSRSSLSSDFPSTMPPSGAVVYPYYLGGLGIVVPLSQSGTSVSVTLGLPEPATDTSTSTELGSTSTPTHTSSFPTTSATHTFSSPATTPSHSSSPFPSTPVLTPPIPSSTTSRSISTAQDSPTTVLVSTTLVKSVNPPSSPSFYSPSTSTYTITTVLLGQGGTTIDFVTTSNVLSTEPPGGAVNSTVHLSPGTVAAIVLGIAGAFAFSALWLFCARRRHRKLVREATLVRSENHAPGPLDDEILDVEELGYDIENTRSANNPMSRTEPAMEERYAGILAALHSTEGFGRGNEGGSTAGVYGSRHDTTTDVDMDDDFTRASSPTLPLHVLPPDDPPYMIPLSPPPPVSQPSYHQATQPAPPPSAYHMASRRRSSPGLDGATWFSGYSVAPSCTSHYARSQTLGSGSGSGSVDALTRTRTGSEEPLLGIGKLTLELSAGPSTSGGVSPTTPIDPGSNRPGLGSAFGSPAASMCSPSSIYPALQYETSGSQGARTASGSGSYGYARSGTPSSFDVLRSVSSQGALSSAYSQGHGQSQGFRFGFGRAASSSSGSTGKRTGSNRYSFGVPPTSFRGWKDRGSASSDKEKQGEKQSMREKDWKSRPRSWTSASTSGSADEKQGRGSPVAGVRALFGRLRRGGHTPSPHSSNKDLPSPTKASTDVDPEKAATDRTTPPPIQIEAATPHRRRLSFILSNPDPHPPSPYTPPRRELRSTQYDPLTSDPRNPRPASFNPGGLQPATLGYLLGTAPSPAPTEESRLAEGLLHPRLQTQECSGASLRDFEDYSRPIGGVVKNRLYSTTTFGTQDEVDRCPGTPVQDDVGGDEHEHDENETMDVFGVSTLRSVPRDSWFTDDLSPLTTARHSPHV